MASYWDDVASFLDGLVAFLRRFVVFQSTHQAVALALWIIHTYALDAADCTPYIWIHSAAPTSGKTRATEVLAELVHAPLRTADASTAAIFREIEKSRCSLILDEIDTKFSGKGSDERAEDLRGLVNAGFNRGAYFLRCVGTHHETKRFDVFCPKVLAGLGTVPDTISKRVVPIQLRRKARSESVERFRRRVVEPEAREMRDAIAQWAADNLEALKEARPSLPDELDDRQQDAWEPLLAIADAAGGDWPRKARDAAKALHTATDDDEATLGVLLLGHIREALGSDDRITTERLLKALIERDDAPWPAWWAKDVEDDRLKGPAAKLSRIIRPWGIKSRTLYLSGDTRAKGYLRTDLEPEFERYLPPVTSIPPENSLRRNSAGQSMFSAETQGLPDDPKSAVDQGSYDVTTISGVRDVTHEGNDQETEDEANRELRREFHLDPIERRSER